MSVFFKKLLGFLLFLVGFALAIQLLVDWRIRHKVVTGVDTLDFTEGQDMQLVFLGSSRCYAGFDPALYEKALGIHAANLGVDGHSELAMHMLRLQKYLAKNPAPRVALLAFDPMVSTGSLENNQNMVAKNQFARYAFWPSQANEPIVRYFHFDPLERNIPLYALLKYKLLPHCLTLSKDDVWKRNRYDRHDEQWDTVSRPMSTSVELTNYYFDTSAAAVKGLEKGLWSLDSICVRHHIILVCVQAPMYRIGYIKYKFDLTGKICADLHIPFFDLCMPELVDSIDNFYNIDHCNTTGVTKMAHVLLADTAFTRLFAFAKRDSTRYLPAVTSGHPAVTRRD